MIAILVIALFVGVRAGTGFPEGVDFAMMMPPTPTEETIVTRHIPPGLRGSLKPTTGELKLFAGFALNIIRHKCQNVDSQKLFQIQKYIGKRISDTGPMRGGQSRDFEDLITKMSTCSKGDAPAKSSITPDSPDKRGIVSFFPMGSVRLGGPLEFLRKHPAPVEEKPEILVSIPEEDDESTQDKKSEDEMMVIDTLPESQHKAANVEKKLDLDQWKTLSHDEKKDAVDSIFDDDELEKFAVTSPAPSRASPPAPASPAAPAPASPAAPAPASAASNVLYSTHIFIPSSSSSSSSSNEETDSGFLSWLNNMWSSVSDFLSRIFGMDSRHKRDTESDDGDSMPALRVWRPQNSQNVETHDQNPGRTAFINLIDEICRIYCDTCSVHSMAQMNNFKLAARELLKFLFEDKTGIDLVASHYLDASFIRSLTTCEPSRN